MRITTLAGLTTRAWHFIIQSRIVWSKLWSGAPIHSFRSVRHPETHARYVDQQQHLLEVDGDCNLGCELTHIYQRDKYSQMLSFVRILYFSSSE